MLRHYIVVYVYVCVSVYVCIQTGIRYAMYCIPKEGPERRPLWEKTQLRFNETESN